MTKIQLCVGLRPLLPVLLLSAVSPAHAAAPSFYVNEAWVSLVKQQASLVYSADVGFPLGERAAESVLDCATGKATTRGFDQKAGFDQPSQAPEDKEGAAALIKSKVVQTGNNAMTFKQGRDSLRFTCKNGVVVTDFSGYAGLTNISSFYRDTVANISVQSTDGMFPPRLTVPGFTVPRSDGTRGTASLTMQFDGDSLKTANYLRSADTNYVFSEDREALFLLEADGKTLRPLSYGGKDAGLKTAVPLQQGKARRTLTFYYTPDYNAVANWQKTVIDFGTYQTSSTTVTRPAGLVFGK